MVDFLTTVDTDGGKREPMPVTLVSGGEEVSLAGGAAVTAARLTAHIPSSAATTNATLIKSSPGYGVFAYGYNNNAAARFLKFYNKATAPVVGTDIPILTYYLEPSETFAINLASARFTLGIGLALTISSPDNANDAVASGDIMGLNVIYA